MALLVPIIDLPCGIEPTGVQSTPFSIYEAVLFDEVIDFYLHSGERDS